VAATLPASSFPDDKKMQRSDPRGGPPVRRQSLPWADAVFSALTHGAAWLTLATLAGIIVSLFIGAAPAIREFGLGFFTSTEWDPVQEKFGGLVMIYGTLMTSLIALLIAVPVSFGIALFLTELSPSWLRRPLGTAIELLAAVPSIVYGMWGLLVFSPILSAYVQQPLQAMFGNVPVLGALFSGPPVGIGLLAAGIILAIMVIPFTSSVAREVLKSVPAAQREGAYALGATRLEAIRAALFYARTGIIGAVMLGFGRALGETMAVTMVIGNQPKVSASLFAPQYTMAAVIANEFTEATEELYLHALVEIGLVLFVITLLVNTLSRVFIWSLGRQSRTTSRQLRKAAA